MGDPREVLIIDIDPAHLSERERALRAVYGAPGAAAILSLDEPPRIRDVQVTQRRRNYDIEGPKPEAGPPTAREADMPSRQQRRYAERQAKKRR